MQSDSSSFVQCFLVERLRDKCWFRPDNGQTETRPEDFGPGAMWLATWFLLDDITERYGYSWENQFTPPLIVMTPGGTWNVDSRADNCTKPGDYLHRCWVRHGEVPNVSVDKRGNTCSAGSGSIRVGNYHGFLIGGQLRPDKI